MEKKDNSSRELGDTRVENKILQEGRNGGIVINGRIRNGGEVERTKFAKENSDSIPGFGEGNQNREGEGEGGLTENWSRGYTHRRKA